MIDLAFVGANALKFREAGWLPVAIGAGVLLLMASWRFGRIQLDAARADTGLTLDKLIAATHFGIPANRVVELGARLEFAGRR